jgi:hypothetical protein
MYQIVPLYILKNKIYLFSTSFLQLEQITSLRSIDSDSDMRGPPVGMMWHTRCQQEAEVAPWYQLSPN